MPAKRYQRQREGLLAEIQDPLVVLLGNALIKCCDELGIAKVEDIKEAGGSCVGCPLRSKCYRLWGPIVKNAESYHKLSLTEYRRFSQKFYLLKQERDRMLAQKGIELVKGVKIQ